MRLNTVSAFAILFSGIGISLMAGCTAPFLSFFNVSAESNLGLSSQELSNTDSADDLDSNSTNLIRTNYPETRVTTINLNGKITEVQLELINVESLPAILYVPAGKLQEKTVAADGTITTQLQFLSEGDRPLDDSSSASNVSSDSYLEVKFLDSGSTLDDVRHLVLGESGLFAQHQWHMMDRTEVVSYSWATERIDYQQGQGDNAIVGSLWIGQSGDRSFYVMTRYPVSEANILKPEIALILENMNFDE
jgi:hypothetical protein